MIVSNLDNNVIGDFITFTLEKEKFTIDGEEQYSIYGHNTKSFKLETYGKEKAINLFNNIIIAYKKGMLVFSINV